MHILELFSIAMVVGLFAWLVALLMAEGEGE